MWQMLISHAYNYNVTVSMLWCILNDLCCANTTALASCINMYTRGCSLSSPLCDGWVHGVCRVMDAIP